MWHKFQLGMSHSYVRWWFIYKWQDSFACAMTHVCVTWPITRVMTLSCVSWLIHVCRDLFIGAGEVRTHSDMIHLFVPWFVHISYDSFICAMARSYFLCLIHMCHDSLVCAMTHSNVPWFIRMCHDSFVCAMDHSYVPWLIRMCHGSFVCAMTHSYVPWFIHKCDNPFALATFGTCSSVYMCGVHICVCEMTHLHVWRVLFVYVLWPI